MPAQKGRGAKGHYQDYPYDDLTDDELIKKERAITLRNYDRRALRMPQGGSISLPDESIAPEKLRAIKREVRVARGIDEELMRRQQRRAAASAIDKPDTHAMYQQHADAGKDMHRAEMATDRKNKRKLAKHRARERYRATKGTDFDIPFWIP